jgi:hypothetical protein
MYPEDGSSNPLRSVRTYLPNYMASFPHTLAFLIPYEVEV